MIVRTLMLTLAVSAASLCVLNSTASAKSSDARIRYITFNANSVINVPCALGISTMIQFGDDEIIETVSAGDTKAWSVVPKKGSGILFVKPIEEGANTNVNVVTNKRVYALQLASSDSDTSKSAFHVRLRYPDEISSKSFEIAAAASLANPDLKNQTPETNNYNYAFKGAESIKPRVAFDNGTKTFLQFAGEVPAIFTVGGDRKESPVNYRREGNYIVIDGISAQFTLRSGSQVLCLFNKNRQSRPDVVEATYGPKPVKSNSRVQSAHEAGR